MNLNFRLLALPLILFVGYTKQQDDLVDACLEKSDVFVSEQIAMVDMALELQSIKFGEGRWERYTAKKFKEKDSLYSLLLTEFNTEEFDQFLKLTDTIKGFNHFANDKRLKDLNINSSDSLFSSLHKTERNLYSKLLNVYHQKIKLFYLRQISSVYCGFGRFRIECLEVKNDSVAIGFVLDRTSAYGSVLSAELDGKLLDKSKIKLQNTSDFTPIDFKFKGTDQVEVEVAMPHSYDDEYSVYGFGWNY